MRRLAAAAAPAVMAAAIAAVHGAAAQDEARWGPVAESLGAGSGICIAIENGGESIVCAVVLCEDGGLTLGVLDTGQGDAGQGATEQGDAGQGGTGQGGTGQGGTEQGGKGPSGEQPAFRGQIEVDGQIAEREMQSRIVMQDFVHVRTPVEPGEPLWQRLRAGNRLALSASPGGEPLDYSLRGSAAELDRVAAACR